MAIYGVWNCSHGINCTSLFGHTSGTNGFFIKDERIIAMGKNCVMVAAVEQLFIAMSMVLGGALRGAGDTKSPFIVSVVSSWFVRIPLMYAVVFIFELGIVYVWWATAFQFFVEAVFMVCVFKIGRWKENTICSQE